MIISIISYNLVGKIIKYPPSHRDYLDSKMITDNDCLYIRDIELIEDGA